MKNNFTDCFLQIVCKNLQCTPMEISKPLVSIPNAKECGSTLRYDFWIMYKNNNGGKTIWKTLCIFPFSKYVKQICGMQISDQLF